MFVEIYLISGYLLFLALLLGTMAVRSKRLGLTVAACLLGVVGGLGSLVYGGNVRNVAPSDICAYYLIVELAVWTLGIRALLLGRGILSRTGKAVRALTWTLLLLTPFLPYLPVEAQTYLLRQDLAPAIHQAVRDITYSDEQKTPTMKVLRVNHSKAEVYLVVYNDVKAKPLRPDALKLPASYYAGFLISIAHTRNGWVYLPNETEVVWSDGGSASGIVFPPYASVGEY